MLTNISVIAVDYGGVLAHHYCEPYQTLLAQKLGVSLEESQKLISEKSEQGRLYRLNKIGVEQFWATVFNIAQVNCKTTPSELQMLWAKTYILDQRVHQLLQILKTHGNIKLCIFSNTDKDRFDFAQKTYNLSHFFDFEIYSWETGLVKPDKNSFINLINICGESAFPDNILLIDDREFAINRAKELGISTYQYTNYEDLVDFLIKSKILLHEYLL